MTKPFILSQRWGHREDQALVFSPGLLGLVLLGNPTIVLRYYPLPQGACSNRLSLLLWMTAVRLVGLLLIGLTVALVHFWSE